MVLKTFNVEEAVYDRFSRFCKEHGISMSKQINRFMKSQIEKPKARRERFVSLKDFAEQINL